MKIASLIDSAFRFDFADSQNRSTLHKPIAIVSAFSKPHRFGQPSQSPKSRWQRIGYFSSIVDKVKIGRFFR
jgi:hypothetical protein